jgi:thioredoxin 1
VGWRESVVSQKQIKKKGEYFYSPLYLYYNNELIKSSKPTLVDFYADWCGPCKVLSPIIEDVKKDLGEGATVLKVNIDNNVDVARMYQIRSIPTLMVFKEGEIVWRQNGVPQKEMIVESVKKFI